MALANDLETMHAQILDFLQNDRVGDGLKGMGPQVGSRFELDLIERLFRLEETVAKLAEIAKRANR